MIYFYPLHTYQGENVCCHENCSKLLFNYDTIEMIKYNLFLPLIKRKVR